MEHEKTITDVYNELYHYTTAGALQGIVQNHELWATNIRYMNDDEERTGYFERRFAQSLVKAIDGAIDEIKKTDFGRSAIQESGGESQVKDELRRDLHQYISDSTLRLDEPYITSFCGPPRIAPADGLLSQWRGYGTDGGYAVVFDTVGLERCIQQENQANFISYMFWGDVEYYDQDTDEKAAHPETRRYEAAVVSAIKEFITTQKREAFEPLYEPITALSCSHKHHGFREEAEVRIITVLPGEELFEAARQGGELRETKRVHFRERQGLLIPYIKLFGKQSPTDAFRLPITKVIVGPHPEKVKRQDAVRRLLKANGYDADVIVSDIPFLGR